MTAPDDFDEDDFYEWTTSRRSTATRVGRYALLREVGCGGMGVVHVAFDEALDRMVAIKFIHEKRAKSRKARERLIREAKAMARLSHDGVVHVYDVGQHHGRLYIAMEYVEGQTLTQWLRAKQRSWPEVLDVFLAVGRGLAAAHRAGVIHRDFKPDNVLIDDDGGAKVADFGLAGVDWEAEDTVPSGMSATVPLTATGALLGTPAYMAPEQHRRESCVAASDQFSFCVALYEAIHGQRPFHGDSAEELARATSRGPKTGPRRRDVPRRVYQIMARGLRPDPDDRYAEMDALLAELRRTGPKRKRPFVVAGSLMATAVAGGVGLMAVRPAEPCAHIDREISQVWSEQTRRRAAAAFTASGLDYAEGLWHRTQERLDTFATRWARLQRQRCETPGARSAISELDEAQDQCLRHALIALDERIKILEAADSQTVQHAMDVVGSLPDLSVCASARVLAARGRATASLDQAHRIDAMTRRLAEAQALADSGGTRAAVELARGVLTDAEALGFAPFSAHARRVTAGLERDLGNFEASATMFERAYLEALAGGDDSEAFQSLIDGIFTRALRLDDAAGALEQVKLARALADRLAVEGTRAEARLQAAIAWANTADGQLEVATDHMRNALELTVKIDGPGRLSSASYHRGIAILLGRLGRYEEALAEAREVHRITEATLGRGHPDTVSALRLVADALMDLQRFDAAEPYLDEVVRSQQSDDTNVPQRARSLVLLARARANLGHVDSAITLTRQAMSMVKSGVGPDHPQLAFLRTNLGEFLRQAGRFDEALRHHVEALRSLEAAYGTDDPRLGGTLLHLGLVLTDLGETTAARETLLRAQAIRRQHLVVGHPDLDEVQRALDALEHPSEAAVGASGD